MEPDALDGFVRGRFALVLGFAWGLCEATFFFIVPDVLLTLIACRSFRRAWRGALAALLGALLGGILMYEAGLRAGDLAERFLDAVPGIGSPLIEEVRAQVGARGAAGVFLGPLRGIPYKIYAVVWGEDRGSLLLFLVMSVPARLVRFAGTAGLAALLVRALPLLTRRGARPVVIVHAGFWLVFYAAYFLRMGW